MLKIVEFSHLLIKLFLEKYQDESLTVIDATCGNGNDTLFLVETLKKGSVIAYDIQEIAINNTKALLTKNGYDQVVYHKASHEHFFEEKIDLLIYNLGYLPKGNKEITTKALTTLESLKEALKIVNKNFLIILVLYPGHKEGSMEAKMIDEFCFKLDSTKYLVSKYQNYNRPTSPYVLSIANSK